MINEDEPSSGLNGRLRPRKSAPSPQAPKPARKPESKPVQDRPKRTSTPSKATATKPDDLSNKSDSSTALQLLCPYCDRKFSSKQAVSKHTRRIHLSNSKQDSFIECLFCSHADADPNNIIRHMFDSHPNQYFTCLDCHTRFSSTSELAEHKLNVCEKQKEKPYRSKLRQKVSSGSKKTQKALNAAEDKGFPNENKDFPDGSRFNGIVISCELKPSQVNDEADIEDNITTNLILPPSKNLGTNTVMEKNAVIVLDDIQWNKRMPPNFSFHNTDADQILFRLGVVHRSPRTGESTKNWYKNAEEPVQKFEKCFDTGFYSKVASNVHENLTKFLDGSFNFNPDPDSIIKTRKSKNSVVINAAEGFPILLAFEQYSRNVFDGYMPRTLAPKHKWKWENDKSPMNPDDIKRDTHVNNCIITLVSSLDIWTQLCMRRKFEDKFSIPPLEKKTEKQNTISKELKEILESRELPTSSREVVKYIPKSMPTGDSIDFPASLGLKPSAPTYDMPPAVLSGEWVRPRCYVCCACGEQTRDARGLSSHISTQHPNAQVQHYEIVGELLLNADILKHLYVPPSQMCNRTRPLRGFRECTKCKKSISLEDLHQHMLDCAGDTPAVRRKCRYRPFGVRRRRTRLPDTTIRRKIRKDIRNRQTRQKTHMRPRPKIRSEVGDAETIRKMLADLPAKRHRVLVNPVNTILRPRRKLDKQRNKIIIKRRSSEIVKNRKQRELRKNINSDPTGSKTGDHHSDNKSDDENKPLKPKIKRVLTHGPRQSESLKRKVALSRAKRRAKIKEQRANEDSAEQQEPRNMKISGSNLSNLGDQLSVDNSPQRIDINAGPYATREQSSRGNRSNNRDSRDDQRPGFSGGENGNLNNSFGPMQNAPLKHSIARLTADNELHDRSMQYHLLRMQPPECPEIDIGQHLPSGQQRVFENDAVVTKLDKPPLHFTPRSPVDAAYHKNKLPNKPKKGLKDCIDMLTKKLADPDVDPDQVQPTKKRLLAEDSDNDSRPDLETILAEKKSALDYQLSMNTKPAEIFSRHQLMQERYMKYSSEAGLIAQNFAELPFHLIPTPRNAYDIPPPEIRVEPRLVPPFQQSEVQNKKEPMRRRSTRGEKGSMVNQDVAALVTTTSVNYPMNVTTPSKVSAGSGRRSSSQSVSANLNTISGKRRASVSYNRINNYKSPVNEYDTILAQQRILEYHAQRIPPEGHVMPTRPETFAQTQINKQNQLIAEQMFENYMNKKQLAICVDNNYTNKMLTAAYAESLYANAKYQSISPGNIYDVSKPATISPGARYDIRTLASVSPGNQDSNLLESLSPGTTLDKSSHASISPGNRYDCTKDTTVSPGSRYDSGEHALVSPGSSYENSNQTAVRTGSNNENAKHLAVISPGSSYKNKRTSLSPGSSIDNSRHSDLSPGSKCDSNKNPAVSPGRIDNNTLHVCNNPGNVHDKSKHLINRSENRYETNAFVVTSLESQYDCSRLSPGSSYDVSKLSGNSSELQYDKKNQTAISHGNVFNDNKKHSPGAESTYDNITKVAISPKGHHDDDQCSPTSREIVHDNSKQAAIGIASQYDSHRLTTTSPGSLYDNSKKALISPGDQFANNHGTISPVTLYDNSRTETINIRNPHDNRAIVTTSPERIISTANQYESNQRTTISPGRLYDNSVSDANSAVIDFANEKHKTSISKSVYEKPRHLAINIDNQYDNDKPAISPSAQSTAKPAAISVMTHFDTNQKALVSPKSILDNSKHLSVSPGGHCENSKLASIRSGTTQEMNTKTPVVNVESKDDDKQRSSSPISTYISKKQAAVAADFINKKQAACSEMKKQLISAPESAYKKSCNINTTTDSESTKGHVNYAVETAFTAKKGLAVAVENNLLNKTQIGPCNEGSYISGTLPQIECKPINDSAALLNAESNNSNDESIESNENLQIGKKQLNVESSLPAKLQVDVPLENNYTNINHKTSYESCFVSKKQIVSTESFLNEPTIQCSENIFTGTNLPEGLPEINSTPRKKAINYYTERNYRVQEAFPRVYTAVNTKFPPVSDDIVPLDLSKTTSKDAETKRDSRDNSDVPQTRVIEREDGVVDLSVKISSRNLSMRSNIPALSKMNEVPDLPTKQGVIKSGNYEYESDPKISTDLSGKLQDVRRSLTSTSFQREPKDLLEMSIDEKLDHLPSFFPSKDNVTQHHTVAVIHQDPRLRTDSDLEKENRNRENCFENCLQCTSMNENTYLTSDFDPSLRATEYVGHAGVADTVSSPLAFVDERSRSPNCTTNLHLMSDNKATVDNIALTDDVFTEIPEEHSSVAGPVPLYTLSNTVMPSSMSKYESTTPVYTLANACISMAKVEPSNVIPMTDTIMSAPNTTIINIAPVYTVTDTTVMPSLNYVQQNKCVEDLLSDLGNPTYEAHVDISNDDNNEKQQSNSSTTSSFISGERANKTENVAKFEDFDPETAKKIAMLPKELVEILGTMPVDHRNQLLNVLPQYVSTSVPTTENNLSTTTSLVNRGVSPSRISDYDIKPSLYSPVSSSQIIRPVSAAISCVEKLDETKFQPIIGPQALGEVNKYEPLEESKIYEIDGNTVIDLTEDEVPSNNETAKVIEESNHCAAKTNETLSIASTIKSNKHKTSDQTASLRAVRIKAPSERNKSLSTDNPTVQKPCSELMMKSQLEAIKDLNNCLDLETLAIQQAEISSTQHNTTIVGNCKYPVAISPSSTEYSGDESAKHVSQQSPVPAVEILVDKLVENKYEKPVPKAVRVTSSITASEENPENINDDTLMLSTIEEPDNTNKETTSDSDETEKLKEARKVSALEPEEDSDDDISLAAIVKKKQRDQSKTEYKTATEHNDKNNSNKKKKKDRRSKKIGKKVQADTHLSTFDKLKADCHVRNNIQSKSKCETKSDNGDHDEELIQDDDNIKNRQGNKHSKKKVKKARRAVQTVILENNHLDKTVIESEKDINKENDSTSEVINNKVNHEENTIIGEHVSQICNKDACLDKNEIQNQPEVYKLRTTSAVCKEVTVDALIKISKCDDQVTACTVQNVNETIIFKGKKKKLEFSKIDKDAPALDDELTYIENNTMSASEVLPQSVRETDSVSENVETKKGKKLVRPKKSKDEEDVCKIDQEIDSSEKGASAAEITENMMTPLRRSRRGKSLFLDNLSMEQKPVVTSEVSVEQKAPLTKKQLIFSKLLLDEGKPTIVSKEEQIKSTDTCDKTEIPEIIDRKQVDETTTVEKSKGTKRRICAQVSKKSKKKKSTDEQNLTPEIDSFDKTQTLDYISDKISPANESATSNDQSIEFSSDLTTDRKNNADEINVPAKDINRGGNDNDKHLISTEKRKNNNQSSFDLSQSSKPKKSKMTKSDKKVEIGTESKHNANDSKANVSLPVLTTETKTACYNLPLPTRRARSKSVVVQSSTYDPYDIDLEDMVEQSEMFNRKEKNTDHMAKVKKPETDPKPINKEDSKTTKASAENIAIDASIDKGAASLGKTEYYKSNVSDSDDSSKSDIPLQKYIEERERKIQELGARLYREKQMREQAEKLLTGEPPRPPYPTTSNILQNPTQTEAEEELRSEQFMESFGFFSERKPRKSNLLASKKISETIHITNESDDMYFGFKERSGKRNTNVESKKNMDSDTSKNQPQPSTSKRAAPKRGRRKKADPKIMPCYCGICKKEFRRPDNYLRHTMSLLHISKLSEVEPKVKIIPIHEEPNYLIAYKQYLDRLKKLTDLLAVKKKKNPKGAARIVLPSLEEILADVNKTVRDQQRRARCLSRDEALFLDCCELFWESYKMGARGIKMFGLSALDILERSLKELDTNPIVDDLSDDGDCDSITAQNILESEEVRNLENDLISGLKEAANASRHANIEYQNSVNELPAPEIEQVEQAQAIDLVEQSENQVVQDLQEKPTQDTQAEEFTEQCSSPNISDSHYDQLEEFDSAVKPRTARVKKHVEVKEKMYPDIQIEDIDMFEDKFDKIKRKCRSQAAAAKQPQPVVDQPTSHKGRKKSDKKKGKRSSKKAKHQSTHVPTKGALKGFDGIKVSIPTSDINISAIVPVSESSPKKKKKSSSKKKRDKRNSESSCKYDSDHRAKDSSTTYKKVDVYEFMDNEDAELFEFRPSTLMERFKSISNNKDMPSTSKINTAAEENLSQGSASDGDDFVYMSDDYVASDDETENSLLSCELGNVKVGSDIKKNSPQKRKDVVEKNAVMGKIFKHNAVRAEKKVIVPKEQEKPKANLDQLFDSLLEEEPNSSTLNSEAVSLTDDDATPDKKHTQPTSKPNATDKAYDQTSDNDIFAYPRKSRSSSPDKNETIQSPTLSKRRNSSPKPHDATSFKKHESLSSKDHGLLEVNYGASTSKTYNSNLNIVNYGASTSKDYVNSMPKGSKKSSPKNYDSVRTQKYDENSFKVNDKKNKKRNDSSSKYDDDLFNSYDDDAKSPTNKLDEGISTSYDHNAEMYDQSALEDETGVARHRARRKCTVGKQNILAETWSSESEPDGGPARPNSAESVISGVSRKKKGRKKDGQQAGGRRGNSRQVAFRKLDIESRVSSSRVSSSAPCGASVSSVAEDDPGEGPSGFCNAYTGTASGAASASGAAVAAAAAAASAMPAPPPAAAAGPSNVKGKPRSAAYYWSSEGDEEQEHLQQHGWIVGDSHKKLVTMLAHAKGRKRNNDDKRHLVE